MNRHIFLSELESYLQDISEVERQEALAYYTSYFEDAGVREESQVIRELGSPRKVAEIIKGDLESGGAKGEFSERGFDIPDVKDELIVPGELVKVEESKQKDNSKTVLYIILAVLAIWVILSIVGSIISAIFGLAFGFLGVLFAIFAALFGLIVSGAGLLFNGIFLLAYDLPTALIQMGTGLGMMVAGVSIVAGVFHLCKLLFKAIYKGVSQLFNEHIRGKASELFDKYIRRKVG